MEGFISKDALMKTPLYDQHVALGARMVDFGGWLMPVQYSGIKEEHSAVRNKVGLFDVCHMGQITVKGKHALEFTQRVSANDAGRLKNGRIQYSFLCNENGGLIDDFLLYRVAKDNYIFLVNASNTDKDYLHLINQCNGNIGEKVNILNNSYHFGMIALQGPKSLEIVEGLFLRPLGGIKYYHFTGCDIRGKKVILSRTGYTGEYGFEILCRRDDTVYFWNELLKAGAVPCGLGARDTLRLEAGMPLHGHELDEDHTPVEAGLSKYIGFNKEEDFLGKSVFLNQRKNGTKRKLIKFIAEGKAPARHGYEIYSADELIGSVTSGSPSITLGKNIGMGYIKDGFNRFNADSEIAIRVRSNNVPAKIVKSFLNLKNKNNLYKKQP